MTHDEAITEAIALISQAGHRVNTVQCRGCTDAQLEDAKEDLAKSMSLLESAKAEPEAGELGTEYTFEYMRNEIDRLTAENQELKKDAVEQLTMNNKILDALNSGINRIQTLTAENKELKRAISREIYNLLYRLTNGKYGPCDPIGPTIEIDWLDALEKEVTQITAENEQLKKANDSLGQSRQKPNHKR